MIYVLRLSGATGNPKPTFILPILIRLLQLKQYHRINSTLTLIPSSDERDSSELGWRIGRPRNRLRDAKGHGCGPPGE
jgi:hypothetical protein